MAVYYTVRCPHCGSIVESGKNRSSKYGSPLKTCRQCGKTYVDDNFVEVGCLEDAEIKKRAFSWQSILWIFLGGLMLCIGIPEGIVWPIIIGILMIGAGVASIISFIMYIPSNDQKLQDEIQQSKKRLSNPNYVIALMEAGCLVTSELVERAKRETGYKDKRDIIREKVMDDNNYDKARYICKSFKVLSDAGEGKCMMCFRTDKLRKCKIKNEIGTREIPICDKCVNRFIEHNPEI